MTSTVLNWIVKKYFRHFIEVNGNKTQASFWSGAIHLENIIVKNFISIPNIFLEGTIEEMDVSLQMPAFWRHPVIISMKNVVINIIIRNDDGDISQHESESESDNDSESNFALMLLDNVVLNSKTTVLNISEINSGCSSLIEIQEFSFVNTTIGNFNKNFRIEGLTMYYKDNDEQFYNSKLKIVSSKLNVSINTPLEEEEEEPTAMCRITISDLNVQLNTAVFVSVSDYFMNILRKASQIRRSKITRLLFHLSTDNIGIDLEDKGILLHSDIICAKFTRNLTAGTSNDTISITLSSFQMRGIYNLVLKSQQEVHLQMFITESLYTLITSQCNIALIIPMSTSILVLSLKELEAKRSNTLGTHYAMNISCIEVQIENQNKENWSVLHFSKGMSMSLRIPLSSEQNENISSIQIKLPDLFVCYSTIVAKFLQELTVINHKNIKYPSEFELEEQFAKIRKGKPSGWVNKNYLRNLLRTIKLKKGMKQTRNNKLYGAHHELPLILEYDSSNSSQPSHVLKISLSIKSLEVRIIIPIEATPGCVSIKCGIESNLEINHYPKLDSMKSSLKITELCFIFNQTQVQETPLMVDIIWEKWLSTINSVKMRQIIINVNPIKLVVLFLDLVKFSSTLNIFQALKKLLPFQLEQKDYSEQLFLEITRKRHTGKANTCTQIILNLPIFQVRIPESNVLELFKLQISEIKMKFIHNSGTPSDLHNLSLFFIQMLSGGKITYTADDYHIDNLYKYFKCYFKLRGNFFNRNLREYEPIIEQWSMLINAHQIHKFSRMKVVIACDDIINFNISFLAVQRLYYIITCEEKCNEEENENMRLEVMLGRGDEKDKIIFWHSGKESVKYDLVSHPYMEIIQLNSCAYRFNSTKMSVHIYPEETIPIRDVDYSFNHIENRRVVLKNPLFQDKHFINFFEVQLEIHIMKALRIDSNISFYNSTDMIVYIKPYSPFTSKFLSSPAVTISPGEGFRIPIEWTMYNCGILASLDKNFANFVVAFERINLLYILGDEYKRSNVEINNENEKEKLRNRLSKKYCRLLELKGKDVQLAFDVIMTKATNVAYETKRQLKDKARNSLTGTLQSYFSYCILINYPIIFENLLPYELSISYGFKSTEVLQPKQKFHLVSHNFHDKARHFSIQLKYHHNSLFESRPFSLTEDLSQGKTKLILVRLKETTENLNLVFRVFPIEVEKCYNDKYLVPVDHFFLSRKIIIFSEYLLVNKTGIRLYLTSMRQKTQLPVYENQMNIFSLFTFWSKVSVKTDYSEWSEDFDITAPGTKGVVRLKSRNEICNKVKRSDVTVRINRVSKFYLSKVVDIEPRFIFINQLDTELLYRQISFGHASDILRIPGMKYQFITFYEGSLFDGKSNGKECIYFQFALNGLEWSPVININKIKEYNLMFHHEGRFKLVRIFVKAEEHMTFALYFTSSSDPQFQVNNRTQYSIYLINTGHITEYPSYSSGPFVFSNLLVDKNSIQLRIGSWTYPKEISFDAFTIPTPIEFQLQKNQVMLLYYSISIDCNNYTRVLSIYTENSLKKCSRFAWIKRKLISKLKHRPLIETVLRIKGIGVSVINEYPLEVLYMSIFKISVCHINHFSLDEFFNQTIDNLIIKVNNIQTDYCLEDAYPHTFIPKIQLLEKNEHAIKGPITPVLQFLISLKTVENLNSRTIFYSISQIDFLLQELHSIMDEVMLKSLLATINIISKFILWYKNTQIKYEYRNQIDNLQQLSVYSHDQDILLQPSLSFPEKCIPDQKLFIENVMISGIHIGLALRMDVTQYEIGMLPKYTTPSMLALGNGFARFTNAPIRSKELIIKNAYENIFEFGQLLYKNFMRQMKRQFYHVLGVTRLLGDEIGLFEYLSAIYVEETTSPRNYFLLGPFFFKKRVKDLTLSRMLSTTLDKIITVTGNLSAGLRHLLGDKIQYYRYEQPINALQGLYYSDKVAKAETKLRLFGIILKPYYRIKHEGTTKSFLKGIRDALIGLTLFPLSLGVRTVNTILTGVKNDSAFISQGSIDRERFRYPRYISFSEPLHEYKDSESKYFSMTLVDGSTWGKRLMYFQSFELLGIKSGEELSHLVIVESILQIFNSLQIVLEIQLEHVTKYFAIHDRLRKRFYHSFALKNQTVLQFIENETNGESKICRYIAPIINDIINN